MAKAALQLLEQGGRFLLFSNLIISIIIILSDIFRVVIHDWERPYYKEGAKSLGYVLETEVSIYACDEKTKNKLIFSARLQLK